MKNIFKLLILFCCLFALLTACTGKEKKYVIGVSQCSDDTWRTKLKHELELATYFNDEVELVMCSANDDVARQRQQIDSLIDLNVDLLIVSPLQLEPISATISHAAEKHIPVILFDRKSNLKDYTAFMGADNYRIGRMLGDYAALLLKGKGTVVEIAGEKRSSPAVERHKGFTDALKAHPDIKMVGYEEGNWKEKSGEEAMDKVLQRLEKADPNFTINLVFGNNDRMAVGARKAIDRYKSTHPHAALTQQTPTFYLGIDALPSPGEGIEKVRDGVLTASAIYPTHGDELVKLALDILTGKPYEKNNDMETSIVTADNAKVLLLQNREIEKQHSYIHRMHTRVDNLLARFNLQRLFLIFVILLVAVISTLWVVSVKAYRTKQRLYEQLRKKNEELNREKATVERQRDELEEQRDQLLDATTKKEDATILSNKPNEEDAPNTAHALPQNEFMSRFMDCLEKRYTNSDLSVEDIGRDMCLSRVQLYRRVKALTGKTPVELIREKRLSHARLLLKDSSLTISEIAYRVGFSAPSYFTKCYRDFYGKAPSEKE